jgi:hypothetical protein
MIKFKDSRDSVASELLLWRETPTQIAIEDIYELTVHPISSIYNNGQINFDVACEPKAMIADIDIITSFRIMKGDIKMGDNDECSIINNFANSLWELVNVTVADRTNLMQSMRNSYAYQTFFDYCLNSDKNREDYLFCTQAWKMDSGKTKADVETMVFQGDGVKNVGAAERAQRIANSKPVTVSSKLHCPLFTTSKSLPSNMKIRIGLSKNSDSFLLMSSSNEYRVLIENVQLKVTYIKPQDVFHSMIEERLQRQPAPYFVTRPQIIIKPISQQGRIVRVNDIFNGKMPKLAFFCIQSSKSFEGTYDSSPFAFIPFSKLQLHINGRPYFNDPLEIDFTIEDGKRVYNENWRYVQQLYKTIGKDVRGCGLIDSKNFQHNFMVGASLTGDRSSATASYLSPQTQASTQIEIDFGYDINVSEDLILLVYAVYDRVIRINSERELELID